MMQRAKLCVVLLALVMCEYGLPSRGFARDYDHTQTTNFGVRVPGEIVGFTVKPPKNARGDDATVTKGYCDIPDGFIWNKINEDPAWWQSTILPDYPPQHNGHFWGEYGYPGTNVSRALMWEATTAAEVVKLETITWATIPANRARKKLGVGEKVALTLKGADNSVAWSFIGYGIIVPTGNSAKFTAYERGLGAVVTATYKGKQFTAGFTVVEPASISAVKLLPEHTYPPGIQGAGMWIKLTIHPTDVSFNEVLIGEVPGPATEVWGFFTKYSSEQLYHHSGPWRKINAENWFKDEAFCAYCTPPWYPGGYKWVIPIEWQAPKGTYIGRLHDNAVQTVWISDTNGTTTVTKFGVWVKRTP